MADRPATVDCRKMIGSGSTMALRILIIDDSSQVRDVVRKVFESEPGWLVCGEASNGQEGIEMAERVHPNLIIIDLSMPIMNGLEAAKILNHSMPSVPLIMFTSFETPVLEQEALAAGISKIVLKSGPLGELMNCVRVFAKDAA